MTECRSDETPEWQQVFDDAPDAKIEDRLRTYIAAGIGPEELER